MLRPGDPCPSTDEGPRARATARLSRRAWLGGVGGIVAAQGLGLVASNGLAGAAPRRVMLFRIHRSTNANFVRYDAVLSNDTTLDPKRPVHAYWVLAAENGRTEPLSSIEQRAYGFRVRPEGQGQWLLSLRAASDRTLRVLRWGDAWVAQAIIAKKSAVLDRLYVEVDDGGIVPKVRWVDLFGRDMTNFAPLRERVVP